MNREEKSAEKCEKFSIIRQTAAQHRQKLTEYFYQRIREIKSFNSRSNDDGRRKLMKKKIKVEDRVMMMVGGEKIVKCENLIEIETDRNWRRAQCIEG